jgi:hypothetical protein
MSDERGRPVGTFSGRRLHPLDPRPEEVTVEDVAHGLGNTCRYGGQCQFYYSVGTHSIYVSSELAEHGPAMALYGLFHDAAEAYITDVPRPLKRELDGYDRIEEDILEAVWDRLGVSAPTDEQWEAVMAADDRLFRYEADRLLAEFEPPSVPQLPYDIRPCEPEAVREEFRARAEGLLDRL